MMLKYVGGGNVKVPLLGDKVCNEQPFEVDEKQAEILMRNPDFKKVEEEFRKPKKKKEVDVDG